MKAKEILYKHSNLNNDGFLSGQVRWIVDAMEEYSNFKINEFMKSKAFYNQEQFKAKVVMTDDVWQDMDNEMLDRVTEFEKHISSKLWVMFVEYLNLPNSYLKAENPYVRPIKD